MTGIKLLTVALFGVLLCSSASGQKGGKAFFSGELKQWHRVTLTFDGPNANEKGTPNPFRDYRLEVTFSKGARRIVVPGFYKCPVEHS